ncbi:MAG: ELWxxDGT repeat protein [Planctomycetota bacterium]
MLTFAIDLFADLNTLGVSSNINEFVQIGDEAFFVADDGLSGAELWKTDKTGEGTVLVKDILPGPDGSTPEYLTEFDGELFFTAIDEFGEIDLWKSDGTESGTVQVFDADVSGAYQLMNLTTSGSQLFFVAETLVADVNLGYELWVSDGTSAGTTFVKDINGDQEAFEGPTNLTDVAGTLFFTSFSGSSGENNELWKSDGTDAGTVMVADLYIDPGDDGIPGNADDIPEYGSYPSYLTEAGGVLYFVAESFDDGEELYRTDGTTAGTVQVADLNPSGSSNPAELTPFGGEVFFAASDGTGGRNLFKTDGVTISLVADTDGDLGSASPNNLEVVGSELFFSANGAVQATSVSADSPGLNADNSSLNSSTYAGVVSEVRFPSGGVLSGFASVVNFNSTNQGGTSSDGPGWVAESARIGTENVGLETLAVGDLYVEDIDGGDLAVDAWEWTVSDPAGLTNIVFSGFASGNEFDSPDEGLVFELFLNGNATPADTLIISGDDALDNWFAGRDAGNVNLFDSGGASITTATVRLSIGTNGLVLPNGGTEAFVVGATLSANLGSATTQVEPVGRELHKTDGTTAGTVLVADIVQNGSSSPSQLTAVGDQLFFSADDVFNTGVELWVSDGTEAGTRQVLDSLPGFAMDGSPLDGAPELLGELGGELLFTTTDANQDNELWLSDGTDLNTFPLANINQATAGAEVTDLIDFGTNLYFVADDGIRGEALYRANTVTESVELIADVSPLSTDQIGKVTVFNSLTERVVFYNRMGGTQGGVYITDGVGGFEQLLARRPVELDGDGTMFVVVNNLIYFVVDDGVNGNELWKSNGTVAGTTIVDSNFFPGSGGSNPRDLTAFNNTLFFSANTNGSAAPGDVGRELFRSDGISITLAADIRGGSGDSSPEELTVSGGNLYFTANDGSSGRELYRYTTTAQRVEDIRSGGGSSNPRALTDVGGVLYFTADNGSDGFEPYRSGGTEATTFQIANLAPGSVSSSPSGFFGALGEVYFGADDATAGRELWKTTGASGNATLVADINPGTSGSDPIPMYDTGDRLLFSATSPTSTNRELWSVDSSTANLFQVEDLFPSDFFGSDPAELTEIGDVLYFAATDASSGRELFQLEQVAPTVEEVIVGGEVGAPVSEVQRSSLDTVTIVFEGRVDVPASAIQLVQLETNTPVNTLIVDVRFENDQTFVDVTFAAGPLVIERDAGSTTGLRNSLADGNYQLTVLSSQVSSPVSGEAMASDFEFGSDRADEFFRLFGDTDGDRDVDRDDFQAFTLAYRSSQSDPNYLAELDRLGDGTIDGRDLAEFRRRFGRRI